MIWENSVKLPNFRWEFIFLKKLVITYLSEFEFTFNHALLYSRFGFLIYLDSDGILE